MPHKMFPDWMDNRERRRQPRQGIFWCRCDRDLVHEGSKCGACGRRNRKYRRNKR
jgi:hypothetical protein